MIKAFRKHTDFSVEEKSKRSVPEVTPKSIENVAEDISPNIVDENRLKATKKRRTSLSGDAVTTAVTLEKPKGHEKERRKSNTPFQRIKVDGINYHDERLKDNTFVARACGMVEHIRRL